METVINSPGDLGCKRGLEHLDELAAKARACNARLMDAVLAGQGSGILANPVIERIAHPTTDAAGRRVPAMRFADPRVQALAGCLAVWDHVLSGITNKSLRAWMAGLRGVPYAMTQASYDLARLRGNGLIERIGCTNTYRLTADGLTFALVYTACMTRFCIPSPRTTSRSRLPHRSAPPGGPSPDISTAPSPHPARPRGLSPCPRSGALSPDSGQPSKSSRPRGLDCPVGFCCFWVLECMDPAVDYAPSPLPLGTYSARAAPHGGVPSLRSAPVRPACPNPSCPAAADAPTRQSAARAGRPAPAPPPRSARSTAMCARRAVSAATRQRLQRGLDLEASRLQR